MNGYVCWTYSSYLAQAQGGYRGLGEKSIFKSGLVAEAGLST